MAPPRSRAVPVSDRHGVDRWLDHLTHFGIKLGLETVSTLLSALDNPHRCYPSVHVAGTNGKGSCVRLVDAVLSACGLTVGRYTSPHLKDFSERIVVANRVIDDADLVRHGARLQGLSASLPQPPTFFEAATVLALSHFACAVHGVPVDAAVVETGLGGRLDATNVLTPRVCVITDISLDHTQHLGATLVAVATEKAGIIKAGIPVVTSAQGEVLEVIRERAQALHAPLYVLGEDFSVVGGATRFSYHGIRTNYHGLTLGMAGDHQRRNAALALAAVELWFPAGVAVAESIITQALAVANWPGRLETVPGHPEVLLDCAHNPAGAQALSAHLLATTEGAPLTLVLGVLADKPFAEIFATLAPCAARVILCAPAQPRAGDLTMQADHARSRHPQVEIVADVQQALQRALSVAAGEGGTVCVAGSVFTVGEAQEGLGERLR